MRAHRDLRLLTATALLCALVALLFPVEGVRLIFAAPLTLVAPGYAIAAAAFARRRLDWPRFALIALTLSLSTLALGGLVLNYTPGGIRSLSWALLLLAVTVAGCWSAARRRPRARPAAPPRLRRPAPAKLALTLGAAALAAAALILAGVTLPAKNAIGYTELWALPSGDAPSRQVQVGVGNQQQRSVPYDLLVKIGEQPLVRRSFVLTPGEDRTIRLDAEPSADGRPVPVTATLLRQNRIDMIYRRVRTWLPAPGAQR